MSYEPVKKRKSPIPKRRCADCGRGLWARKENNSNSLAQFCAPCANARTKANKKRYDLGVDRERNMSPERRAAVWAVKQVGLSLEIKNEIRARIESASFLKSIEARARRTARAATYQVLLTLGARAILGKGGPGGSPPSKMGSKMLKEIDELLGGK